MKHSPVIVDTPRRCGCRKEIELLIAHAKSDRIFFRVEQLNASGDTGVEDSIRFASNNHLTLHHHPRAGRRPGSRVVSPRRTLSRSIEIPCLTGPNSAKRREIALRVVCTSLRDDGLPPSHTALPGPHGPHWTTLDQVGGGPAWSSARQPGDAPRRPETRCDRRRMPRCVPLSSPRFDPAACLAECAALSARREGPTRLDPDWPGWTTLDQAGPPWTTLDQGGWSRGRRPQIVCKCDSTTLRRDPGWSSWTGPLDHPFSFFKVSIIITATPTHRNCPAEAWLAADPRRAAEVRSSRRPKRCAEGWSTGPLQGRPPPIADLTRAMCVSGDSVHFRSGPPPAAEVVQWTRHLVQGGPLQPSARPDLSPRLHRREP